MWGAIAGALGGSLISAGFANRQQNKNLNFQREMAQNAHQYQVADMKAAGLNPILSATGGGAKASGGSAIGNIDNTVNSAISVRRSIQELKNLKAQEEKTKAETNIVRANTAKAEFKGRFYDYGNEVAHDKVGTDAAIGAAGLGATAYAIKKAFDKRKKKQKQWKNPKLNKRAKKGGGYMPTRLNGDFRSRYNLIRKF